MSIFTFILLSILLMVEGGFLDYQCPPGPNVRSPCMMDCVLNHNAIYGVCGQGEDYNCYCGRPRKSMSSGIQCIDKFNSAYDMVCRIDCLCNHGALDSKCHWDSHTCECLGQSLTPTVNNCTLCPFVRKEDMQQYVIDFRLPGFPSSPTAALLPPGFHMPPVPQK